MHDFRKLGIAIAVVACSLSLVAAERGTTADDLPRRDMGIHWPKRFDPSRASLFSHNELLIHADCHRVFTRLADVTKWPDWFVLVKDVQVDGAGKTVRKGTLLSLKIFNTPITAQIDEFVPDSRMSWIPRSVNENGSAHYHTWHLIPEASACRVVTEETGVGPGDLKMAREGSSFMHRAHELWLASLRWTSEQ